MRVAQRDEEAVRVLSFFMGSLKNPTLMSPPSLDECQRIRAAVAEHVRMTATTDLPEGHDDLLADDEPAAVAKVRSMFGEEGHQS